MRIPLWLRERYRVWRLTRRGDSEIYRFLIEHGDRRITRATLAFYRHGKKGIDYSIWEKTVWSRRCNRRILVGLSLCAVRDLRLEHSITAIHSEYRELGIGKALLREKLAWAREHGYEAVTFVAEDNPASCRLVRAAGLLPIGSEQRTRKGGTETYTAMVFRGEG
jgi:ribosomal protein S18 acetylase RimI-like enzyme